MGAILTQQDDRGKHQAVGFLSKTFNEVERNYDIHNRCNGHYNHTPDLGNI